MKNSHLTVYIIFAIAATVILVNRYTPFHINDYRVHFLFLFCAASAFVIIIGHFFNKLRSNKAMLITFLTVGILCFAKAFFTWGGDWKTQTILYRNVENSNKTIDFQMRADRFSFGYKKRTVAIYKLAPFMEWVTDIDTLKMNHAKWQKTDVKVNAMQLPE